MVLVLIFFSSLGPGVFLLLSSRPFFCRGTKHKRRPVSENCPDLSVKLIIDYMFLISTLHFFFFHICTHTHILTLTPLFQILCAFFGYHLLETASRFPSHPFYTLVS